LKNIHDNQHDETGTKKQSNPVTRMKPSVEKDLMLFESMIDFTTQCTFIALHRRCYNAICESFVFHIYLLFKYLLHLSACELNRLFRNEFFNVAKYLNRCEFDLSFREQQVSI
jgi:hypothetical protein